ncbi:MAG: type I-B CRISPR-associated protein Cas8b1/Cst1 [Anaerolineae bacterium]
MLKYTGHPLVDVGIATILAFVGKNDPATLTEADLDKVADYIADQYTRQPLKSFLTVAFMNSGFTQPAFEAMPERRREYASRVLRSYRADTPTLDEQCVFTGLPATNIIFNDRDNLPAGRAFRQHIPLITGVDVINFHPYGDAGLPVSGLALLAIQAFPLGCGKAEGRLLAVHSDSADVTLYFARVFLQRNMAEISLAQQANSTKLGESSRSPKTLVIDTLVEASAEQLLARIEDGRFLSITVYHLGGGQNPALDIYELPSQLIHFLADMNRPQYTGAWHALVRDAWETEPRTGRRSRQADEPFRPRRNWLYEDFFQLPLNAHVFVRKYFLHHAWQSTHAMSVARRSDEPTLLLLHYWPLTARFLERILNMDQDRINRIRELADQLADYVSNNNDRAFFRALYTADKYPILRNEIIKVDYNNARQGNGPIVTFDQFVEVFGNWDEANRFGYWLFARDLLLIRMIERLQEWLPRNREALPVESGDAEAAES